jgi:hypothetical protein
LQKQILKSLSIISKKIHEEDQQTYPIYHNGSHFGELCLLFHFLPVGFHNQQTLFSEQSQQNNDSKQ